MEHDGGMRGPGRGRGNGRGGRGGHQNQRDSGYAGKDGQAASTTTTDQEAASSSATKLSAEVAITGETGLAGNLTGYASSSEGEDGDEDEEDDSSSSSRGSSSPTSETSSSDSDEDSAPETEGVHKLVKALPTDESAQRTAVVSAAIAIDIPAQTTGKPGYPVCRYFTMKGKCRDGGKCRFQHIVCFFAPVPILLPLRLMKRFPWIC